MHLNDHRGHSPRSLHMTRNPLHDVAIVGVHNTVQARVLPEHTSLSISLEAVRGVLADSGVPLHEIDGVSDSGSGLTYELGIGPAWRGMNRIGVGMVME